MKDTKKCIFKTENDWALLILRLGLGIMILPHGLQKTIGMFGGGGFSTTVAFMGQMGIPAFLAVIVIAAEFLGGLGLIVGLCTRIAAFGVGMTMLVAGLMVHLPNGFFMNWMGGQKGEGVEFHLLAVCIAAALMIKGGGALSIDRKLNA